MSKIALLPFRNLELESLNHKNNSSTTKKQNRPTLCEWTFQFFLLTTNFFSKKQNLVDWYPANNNSAASYNTRPIYSSAGEHRFVKLCWLLLAIQCRQKSLLYRLTCPPLTLLLGFYNQFYNDCCLWSFFNTENIYVIIFIINIVFL